MKRLVLKILLIIFVFGAGCDEPQKKLVGVNSPKGNKLNFRIDANDNLESANNLFSLNDINLSILIPEEYLEIKGTHHMSEWVADHASSNYYEDDNSILCINNEIPHNYPYFFNELGREIEVLDNYDLFLERILFLAISNANGNSISSWNKKEITEIGGRKCVYVDFEARNKRNVSVIWLTDSLYFVELFYQTSLEVNDYHFDSILESVNLSTPKPRANN